MICLSRRFIYPYEYRIRLSLKYGGHLAVVYAKSESLVLLGSNYNDCSPLGLGRFDNVFEEHFVDLGFLKFSLLRAYLVWC